LGRCEFPGGNSNLKSGAAHASAIASYNAGMNLGAHIEQAGSQRGRLEALLAGLSSHAFSDLAPIRQLAAALLHTGAFAQVLELYGMHPACAGDADLCATAGTAAANLGLSVRAMESLEHAANNLREDASPAQIEHVCASLGRLYKQRAIDQVGAFSRAQLSQFPAPVQQYLARALACYARAYAASGGIWSGINVATLQLLLGNAEQARAQAIAVRTKLQRALANAPENESDLQWQEATLGEVALLLSDKGAARAHYQRAAAMAHAHKRFADIASMRRQARLILMAQNTAQNTAQNQENITAALDALLPAPKILVFSGHRLDQHSVDVESARFSSSMIAPVHAALAGLLRDQSMCIAYTALSEGADVIFAMAALAAGLELHVLLATDAAGLEQSWEGLGLGNFATIIPPILDAASKIYALAPEGSIGSALDYRYANEILLGSALLRAGECESTLLGVAVWDGKPARGEGGTASMIGLLQAKMAVHVIAPGLPPIPHLLPMQAQTAAAPDTHPEQAIKVLLFADFVGYSKLGTAQTRDFVQRALPLVAAQIAIAEAAGALISARNTWGDGLFLVFDSCPAAASFALNLQASLEASAAQFDFPLKLRIALHCAPVMLGVDPISLRPNAFGPSVSRAARLEPATAPGAVYASEAFAAQLMLHAGPPDIRCRYLAQLPWAKGYGTFPTFIVEAR
jgi:class 3 adenylate cyclase/post-segregation antitoxin (ccd killing protein)